LDAGEVEALDQHLAECPDCARQARAERAADTQLAAAMRAVAVPAGLRDRLLSRLATDRAEQRRASLRRRARWAAAAAAVLILSVGVFWQARHPRKLNVEQAAFEFFEKRANPSPESVRVWFQERHFAVVPPAEFNYRLLAHYDLGEVQGERVPLLLFTHGQDQALVYLLSGRQFDLKALSATADPGSSCKMELRFVNDEHDAYLIFYTGDSLDKFLAAPEGKAT
jgi:hypothetical protein